MEGSANANAMKLASSVRAVAEQPTFNDNRQPTAVSSAQGQTSLIKIENEPSIHVDGIVEDQQPHVVYHMGAGLGAEAELIHVNQHPNNTVDFSAGIQHSEVNGVSSESESEGEMQESDDGDGSPMQGSSNIGSGAAAGNEAKSNSPLFANATEAKGETSVNPHRLATHQVDVHLHTDIYDEERDIFIDFDEAADVDDDEERSVQERDNENEERSVQERDNEIEEDIGFALGSTKAFAYPETTQIINQHLSTPSQQSFTSLDELLSSHNAPGRGLFNVEKVLEHEEGWTAELEEKMRHIQAELEEVKARRDRAVEIVQKAGATFSMARSAAGIRKELWEEYEAFCESLEPKFGNRGGWSVTCFESHSGSYVQWDPNLELFLQSAEMPLGSCNFRCEATAVKSMGRTEYVVEFWPLASPEPRTKTARTWKQQYPDLYRLANQAANNLARDNTIAKALLRSLPDPTLPFSGGWLFEYVLEPGRGQHPTASRRWTYRSSCRIPVDEQQDQGGVTVQSESDSAASQDEEMEYGDSEPAESQDVAADDEEIESTDSQDVKMEDDE